MITKLTKAQTDKFPEYVEKWTKIGLSTEPADRPKAESAISLIYKTAGLPDPKIVWCGSPIGNGLTRSVILLKKSQWQSVGQPVGQPVWQPVWQSVRKSVRQSVWQSVGQPVWQSVRESVGQPVWQSVWQSVRKSVGQPVRQSVWQSVGQPVWQSVRESVRESVRQSVRESVRQSVSESVSESVRESVWQSVWQSGYGQHDSGFISFYEFFRHECGLKSETEKLQGIMMLCESAGWYLPHKNICWVSERHNLVRRNDRGQLHYDGGPALQYPDGWSSWSLNGVLVSQEIAETKASELDPKLILKEQNAEIRREIVRKVGIERICLALGATSLDKQADYELLNLNLGDGRARPYLKMRNPSIGVWHLEGVPPDCLTVEKALNFRNGTKEKPEVLT